MIVKFSSEITFIILQVTTTSLITRRIIFFGCKKMSENDGPSFCRRLRDATKDIHDTSDKLVNLKLGISMSNDVVWANGLLVFAKVSF